MPYISHHWWAILRLHYSCGTHRRGLKKARRVSLRWIDVPLLLPTPHAITTDPLHRPSYPRESKTVLGVPDGCGLGKKIATSTLHRRPVRHTGWPPGTQIPPTTTHSSWCNKFSIFAQLYSFLWLVSPDMLYWHLMVGAVETPSDIRQALANTLIRNRTAADKGVSAWTNSGLVMYPTVYRD